jgi:hypothetical protein
VIVVDHLVKYHCYKFLMKPYARYQNETQCHVALTNALSRYHARDRFTVEIMKYLSDEIPAARWLRATR